jgi:hypothetical protein
MANKVISTTFAGLGTAAAFTADTTDIYNITGTITLPTLTMTSNTMASQVVVTINRNGSPIFTTTPGTRGFSSGAECAPGDTVTVVVSSSLASDAAPMAVKSTISISEGL